MNVGRGLLAPRDFEVAPARSAGADEDRVVFCGEQLLQAVDAVAAAEVDADAKDVADFLVDYGFGKAELGDLRADHAACPLVAVEHRDLIAERREIARHRERSGARPDQRDAFAVFPGGCFRKPAADIVLKSAATRFRRQIATGSGFSPLFSSTSRGGTPVARAIVVRPRTPETRSDSQLIM